MSRRSLGSLTITLGLALLLAQPLLGSLSVTPTSRAHTAAVPLAGSSSSHAAIASSYGQIPLAFELNAGQTNSAVRFLAHGSGYTLYLTPDQAMLSLRQSAAPASGRVEQNAFARAGGALPASAPAQTLGMRWLGANPHPLVTGEGLLPGTVNYFIGNDPTKWHPHIPTYQQVRYHNVYPGVDLIYYGTHGQPEYDFVVAPGADPSRISLGFSGASQVGVDLAGNLSLSLPGGALQQDQPAVYQTVNGTRRMVSGGFTLTPKHQVGFAVGAYNPHLPLVIDPAYKFSTYLGGSGSDNASAVAVDSAGNAYLTGYTASTDFPTATPAQSANAGSTDVFVAKFNPAGSALIYSTYLGGGNDEAASAIALDSMGDAYVTGNTQSINFPVLNAFQKTLGGSGATNAFVTKLTANGSGLWYSTYLGGNYADYGSGIAVDSAGSAYLAGYTYSANFPTHNPIQGALDGHEDAFVSKLNPTGNGLAYSTYLGGSSLEEGYAIALDNATNAYITGITFSSDFPTTAGAFQRNKAQYAQGNAFLSKVNAAGSSLTYSTYLGGDNGFIAPPRVTAPTRASRQATSHIGFGGGCVCADEGFGIAVDAYGDAYVTGATNSPNFPVTPGAFQTAYTTGSAMNHGFVTKFNSSGSGLVYSTFLEGSYTDTLSALAIDVAGNAYVTGTTDSANFPMVNPLQASIGVSSGTPSTVVSELNASGTALLYSSYLGGSNGAGGQGIALNQGRDVYVAGSTISTDFPVKNAFQSALDGTNYSDAFVTKMRLWPSVDTTTGVFRPSNGVLYLKNSNSTGYADITLYYGQPGDQPVTGDWTGKGYRSIGVFRAGRFLLRNANTTGVADLTVYFGTTGDLPVAGDWTGKGYDSVGVFRSGTWYLRNSNTTGGPDLTVSFGAAGDLPVVGDWTGKGYDSIGVYRPSTGQFYLRNSNTTGPADLTVTFGTTGDLPLAGDWTAKGYDSIGIYRNGTYYLRNSNTTGAPDISFTLGVAGDQPIAGPWLAPPGSVAAQSAPAPVHTPTRHPAVLPKGHLSAR